MLTIVNYNNYLQQDLQIRYRLEHAKEKDI